MKYFASFALSAVKKNGHVKAAFRGLGTVNLRQSAGDKLKSEIKTLL